MSFLEKVTLAVPGFWNGFLQYRRLCLTEDEEQATCYERLYDKLKVQDMMKVAGNSGKKVVDSRDTIDQQKSEPMGVDAEKAVTNGRGKLKEDGFFDGKSDSMNCMEKEDGSIPAIKKMSSIASEYNPRGYKSHLWPCKSHGYLKKTMTLDKVMKCHEESRNVISTNLDLTDISAIEQEEVFSGEPPTAEEEERYVIYGKWPVIHMLPHKGLDSAGHEFVFKTKPDSERRNLTKKKRLASAIESKAERRLQNYWVKNDETCQNGKGIQNQLEINENANDWEICNLNPTEMLKYKIYPVEILRNIDKTDTVIKNLAQMRKDEQSIQNQIINLMNRLLTDICGHTMTRKIAITESICKQAELYALQLLWMTKVPLMSYDINDILFAAPYKDDIFEISVIDFKSLYISALYDFAIDPVTIFHAWMKKMTFRWLNETDCYLSKTSYYLCFKLKTVRTILPKSNANIFSFDWKEVSLHSPENKQTLPDNLDSHSCLQDRSLKQCHSKDRALDQIRPMCKPIYGTVDLKTGQDNFVSKLHETEKNSSGNGEKETSNKDLVKETILSNSFQQALPNYYTVFPVHKGQPEKLPKRSESQRENVKRRNSDTEDFANGSGLANEKLDGDGACATNTESTIQRKGIDHVSIDCHHSSPQSFQTDCCKKGLSMSLAENATFVNNKHENKKDCTKKTRNISDQSKQQNVISRNKEPSKIKESTCENSKHNDSWQTNISRHPTSTDNERSASNFTNRPLNQSDKHSFESLMCIINKLSRGECVPPQVSMQYEMLRFCTLRSFPKENKPYITRLAQAGFYYANNSDEVVCYCCAQRKRNWEEHDIPMDVHRQLNPNCKYLLRNSEVNVPIKTHENFAGILTSLQDASIMRCARRDALREDSQQLNREVASTTSNRPETVVQCSNKLPNHSIIGSIISNQNEVHKDAFVSSLQQISANDSNPHGDLVRASAPKPLDYERRQQAASNKAFEPLNSGSGRTPSQTGGGDFGTPPTALPKYPKYVIRTVRMSSFSDCGDIVVSPESLVEAGFFYAGFGDCVRCFQCGVGLRHWSVEDDPWIEHARWSKECSYVSKMRGQEFINLVQMAVQYQSDQQSNETAQNKNVAGSNQGATGRDEIEMLLHKNSAQSVLEMGYHPDIIRRAIRAVLEEKGRESVSAANLMEKIFEIEEAETPSEISVEQREVLELSNQTKNHAASSRLHSEPSTTLIERKESQRFAETTRGELQSARTAENMETRSHANLSVQLASSQSGSSNNTRASKTSQLLEKRKLKEENEKLKQQSVCTKCRKNEVCIVFLPCGHLITCETCAPTIKYCTVQSCGKYIKGTVRTYLS